MLPVVVLYVLLPLRGAYAFTSVSSPRTSPGAFLDRRGSGTSTSSSSSEHAVLGSLVGTRTSRAVSSFPLSSVVSQTSTGDGVAFKENDQEREEDKVQERLHPQERRNGRRKRERPWTYDVPYSYKDDWGWNFRSVTGTGAVGSYEMNVTAMDGTVPEELRGGCYYKNGHGNLERGGRRVSHILDGDGFVFCVRFHKDGTGATYIGRFVETEYYLHEEKQDQFLYRNVFGTQRDGGWMANAFDLTLKNPANTNVVHWAGRLYALWEAGRPYELDPVSLTTLPLPQDGGHEVDSLAAGLGADGRSLVRGITIDRGGPIDTAAKLGMTYTAHPVVTDNGETLIVFRGGHNPIKDERVMEFVEYDRQCKICNMNTYAIPGTSMAPHDFAVTDDYYVFFENMIELDRFPYLVGDKCPAQVLQQRLDRPSRLHFAARSGGTRPSIVVDVPTIFCIHTGPKVHMSDDGTTATVYCTGWDLRDPKWFPSDRDSVPFLGSWKGQYPDSREIPPTVLFQTVVDLDSAVCTLQEPVVPGLCMEFPQGNDCEPNIVYGQVSNSGDGTIHPPTGWARVNVRTGETEYYWAPPKTFCEEPLVVPKNNRQTVNSDAVSSTSSSSSGGSRGGGNWILGMMHDRSTETSSLAILDSNNFERGPVCRLDFKYPLMWGIHGTFASAAEQ